MSRLQRIEPRVLLRYLSAILLLPSVVGRAQADNLSWSADVAAGVENSSNVDRSQTAPDGATFPIAVGAFTAVERTQSLYADLSTADTWIKLPSGISGSDFTPALNAFLIWTPIADVFSWRVSENLGEIAPEANGSLAQADRERINVASTGPDLHLALGQSGFWLSGAARFSVMSFQNNSDDSGHRIAGQVGIGHELGFGGDLSLNASESHTTVNEGVEDFNVTSGYANYRISGGRTTVDASLGVAKLGGADRAPLGTYVNLELQRLLSARTSVTVDFVHRLADGAAIFSREQDLELNLGSITNLQSTSEAINETSGTVNLNWTGRRTDAALSVYDYREKESSGGPLPFDQRGTDVSGNIDFRLRPNLSIGGIASILWWSDAVTNDARATTAGLTATYRFQSHFGLQLGYAHYSQTHSDIGDYSENRYFLLLTWHAERGDPATRRPEFDSAERRRIQYGR
jgi:hypothetical protein